MLEADTKTGYSDPKLLSPTALAFIGDGVYELLVRERLLRTGSMPANKLHRLAVELVRAGAQALAYDALEPVLEPCELDILRRGRNAKTSNIPKSSTPAEYAKATALEALFGYLYLCGDTARVKELFETAHDASAV